MGGGVDVNAVAGVGWRDAATPAFQPTPPDPPPPSCPHYLSYPALPTPNYGPVHFPTTQ